MNLKYLQPKTIFLIDGIGAGATAVSLYAMKVLMNEYFGMPTTILTYLSAIAVILCLYSFFCFAFVPRNSKTFLRIVGYANLFYCCLTAFYVVYYYQHLTVLGVTYFLVEIGIICMLVSVELTRSEIK